MVASCGKTKSIYNIVLEATDIYRLLFAFIWFSEVTLYWGGGVANQGSLNNNAVTVAPYYGDYADDHFNIELGYDMFNSDYPNYPAVGYEGIPIEPGILAAVGDLILDLAV